MKKTDKIKIGGDIGIDLFEDYENIPKKVQTILDKYEDAFVDGDYKQLEKATKELNKIGYTFDYGLDGGAYDLRPIGTKGKSEMNEFRKGGEIGKELIIGSNIEFLKDIFVTQESDDYDSERGVKGKVLKIVKKDENNNIFYLKDTAENLTRDDRFPYIIGFNKLKDLIQNKHVKIHNKQFTKGGSLDKENSDMVLNNNKQISHHTKELANAVNKNKNIPAWVVAKINRSATDISDATHYLEGAKYTKGGNLGFCYSIGGL